MATASPGRSLLRWALRSHRNGALAIGLGSGFLVGVSGPGYLAAARVIAGGLRTLGAQAQPIAQGFQFLTGPASRLDTIGGYLSYKVFGSVAVLVAIYAALQGTQVIRGAETKGLFDLWLAATRTRGQIMRDRVVAFSVALAGIVLLTYLGTGISGSLSEEPLWVSGIGQCVAVGAVGAFSFALALVLSQFFVSTRTAAGITAIYLVAMYFVANISDSLSWASFLRYFSPFFYYLQNRTLVPGTGWDLIALAVLVGGTVVLLAIAWRVSVDRDSGGIALARIEPIRSTDHRFRPSRIWRRWLWINWIWEQRVGVSSWFLGIFALTAVETAVVPTALELIRKDSGQLAKLAQFASFGEAQYVAALMAFVIVVVAGFVIAQVARWAGDASQHRVDAFLAQPVGIARFIGERVVSLLVLSALMALAIVLGAMVGATIGGYALDGAGLLRTFWDVVLFGFAVGGVGLLAVAAFRGGLATAIISGLVVASFFLTTIAGLFNWPSWTNRPSVFDAFGSPYAGLPKTGGIVYLAALGTVGAVAACVVMMRGTRIAQ